MKKSAFPINDWKPKVPFSKEVGLPPRTVSYLSRKDIREDSGFIECMRFLTPRIVVYSASRYFKMLDKKNDSNRVA